MGGRLGGGVGSNNGMCTQDSSDGIGRYQNGGLVVWTLGGWVELFVICTYICIPHII